MRFLLSSVSSAILLMSTLGAQVPSLNSSTEVGDIVRLLEVRAGSVVADIGAAGGAWSMDLAHEVGPTGHVFATDVRPHLVDAVRRRARTSNLTQVTAVLVGQEHVGLPDGCCDAVLVRLTYHAFKSPEVMRRGIKSAIKRGGRVLVIDFSPPMAQLTDDMQSVGFERIWFDESWQGRDDIYAALFRSVR